MGLFRELIFSEQPCIFQSRQEVCLMVFKIMLLDKTSAELKRYRGMSVFGECGFEIVGHVFDLTDSLVPAAKSKFDFEFFMF